MKLNHYVMSLFLLIGFTNGQENRSYFETLLKNDILFKYDKKIRPNETVYMKLGISLLKITNLDEVKEIMRSSAYLFTTWKDSRLGWTPCQYNNITNIFVPVNQLWIPDLYIINSADSTGFIKLSDSSLALMYYDGSIIVNNDLPGKF